jgi:hypothetical protein
MIARLLAFASLAILGAATPAAASDRIYDRRDGDLILTDFQGKAYWEVQAMCAGFHRATAAYWLDRGRRDRARLEQIASAQATNRVVVQLQRDRGAIDRSDAILMAAPSEQVGWRMTHAALAKDGDGPDGEWNFWRNFCFEADRAFFKQ